MLWLRGPNQVKTRTGALLFRELRDNIVSIMICQSSAELTL